MPDLTFPRWLGTKSFYQMELHGFCDASQQAIAAVVYIKTTNQDGVVSTNLIASKTKVAPLKKLTIPRLELSGAVLLTKLVSHILHVIDINKVPIYLWTDSAITQVWINNHPSRWKEFVHNRVSFIQETLPQAIWRFLPGKENPADLATRGLTPVQLSQSHIWWIGPNWLSQQSSTWPMELQIPSIKENLEERPKQVSINTIEKPKEVWDLLNRYSSLTKLLRITALCNRVINRLRKIPNSSLTTTPITTAELENAKIHWIRIVQQLFFFQEISTILKGHTLSKSNSLSRLTPFIDSNNLLRIGRRLQSSQLPENSKHLLIIPRDSTLTKLIISDVHNRTLHGGTQITLSYIRTNYWIIDGRAPVRSYILKCVRCARFRQNRAQQLMGQLPTERLTPSRSFLHSGIDYAGPFFIKSWKGRNNRSYKAYIVLFISQATSAVHLELVTDYTTEAFIAAYKRFTARRGICAILISDCGTNLKGADAELQKLFSSSSKELKQLATLLANDGTQWKFNPPATPHFGGRWEAGVKSVKFHLKRVVGDKLLTYKEMYTLLTQIEAILNSRPLCPLTEDHEDLAALTPGYFLIGNAPTIIPELSLEKVAQSHLKRWQLIRQMLDSFWSKWSTEYL